MRAHLKGRWPVRFIKKFAWLPIRIEHTTIWLENVYIKQQFCKQELQKTEGKTDIYCWVDKKFVTREDWLKCLGWIYNDYGQKYRQYDFENPQRILKKGDGSLIVGYFMHEDKINGRDPIHA